MAIVVAAIAAPASAQAIFRCVSDSGSITYQETACPILATGKRLDTSHGGANPRTRELLEREAYRGNRLARGFLEEVRERERRELRERMEREERVRQERLKEIRAADEPPPWITPWGWPGPPGLARPRPNPSPP